MERAAQLNRDCQCVTVDRQRLSQALREGGAQAGDPSQVAQAMFADVPVFLAQVEIDTIAATVRAVRHVVGLPAFEQHALGEAPAIAQASHGPVGTLFGYDFHLTPEGPRLIEINTNAGGALLSAALSATQASWCDEVTRALWPTVEQATDVPARWVQSFVREYQRQRGVNTKPAVVAIVDAQPTTQFLYPEFKLFQHSFEQAGMRALIVDIAALEHRDGGLWAEGTRIDLVYNRATDFYFAEPSSAALASAYRAGDVVVTPNPHTHALFANKQHLVTLGDADALRQFGAHAEAIAVLSQVVPPAEPLTVSNHDRLWAERKGYFFKPRCGYGSKAAYRGDKLTRKTWEAIVQGDYIAQRVVTPSERVVPVDGRLTPLKLDVRAYVDDEQVLLLASRLYQGQTTNFRTPGGGFASVFTARAG